MRKFSVVLAALLVACAGAGTDRAGPVRLTRSIVGSGERLTLVAAPGIRINARLKPALELPGGAVFRFDSPRLTADSSYFTEPPVVTVPGRSAGGLVRVSVCGSDAVCRGIVLPVREL